MQIINRVIYTHQVIELKKITPMEQFESSIYQARMLGRHCNGYILKPTLEGKGRHHLGEQTKHSETKIA